MLHIHCPVGTLGFVVSETHVLQLHFGTSQPPTDRAHPLASRIALAVNDYFSGNTANIDLPFHLAGTAFQQRVWQAISTIPRATTQSYSALALQLNSHPRAIGQACRQNPLPLIIPCHRVTAKHALGGFLGNKTVTTLKQALLTLESTAASVHSSQTRKALQSHQAH